MGERERERERENENESQREGRRFAYAHSLIEVDIRSLPKRADEIIYDIGNVVTVTKPSHIIDSNIFRVCNDKIAPIKRKCQSIAVTVVTLTVLSHPVDI